MWRLGLIPASISSSLPNAGTQLRPVECVSFHAAPHLKHLKTFAAFKTSSVLALAFRLQRRAQLAALFKSHRRTGLLRLGVRCCHVKHYEPVFIVCQQLSTNK
jgi:hypothetical protein